jgi:hypothetical protein
MHCTDVLSYLHEGAQREYLLGMKHAIRSDLNPQTDSVPNLGDTFCNQ